MKNEDNYGFLACAIEENGKIKWFVHHYKFGEDIAKIMRFNKVTQMLWFPNLSGTEYYVNKSNEFALRDGYYLDKDISDFWNTDRKMYC